MINKLKNCYIQDHISDLPNIINDNNEAIKSEFNNIYDTSLNLLKKSIYAPVGYVNTYFGDFCEILTEYLTVQNASSILATINGEVILQMSELLKPHNDLPDRWSSIDASNMYGSYDDIMHDASSIIYDINDSNSLTLHQKIKSIENCEYLSFYDPITDTSASLSDLKDIIDWKDTLTFVKITVTNELGWLKPYKILCKKK